MTNQDLLSTIDITLNMVNSCENASIEPEGFNVYNAREILTDIGQEINLENNTSPSIAEAMLVLKIMNDVNPAYADLDVEELYGSQREYAEEFRHRHKRLRQWLEDHPELAEEVD